MKDPSSWDDPVEFFAYMWPQYTLYDLQREIMWSAHYDGVTCVPAGNELGKDFIAGAVAVVEFLMHDESRVVTTSVADDHLVVLWGEIGRFIQTAAYPLTADRGGPLIVNHRHLRKLKRTGSGRFGEECKISYVKGMVAEVPEKMAGHHAEHTLAILDEASGVNNAVIDQMQTWADHMLLISNCNPTNNLFKKWVDAGDLVEEVYG